jgi:sugar-specific transcriptional regulator TrmB
MDIEEKLRKAGLNKNEVSVYLYLLEQGNATPPQVAKSTGIQRTNVYHLLRSLKERGLVEEHMHGKRKAYAATDPFAIVSFLERQKSAVESALPDLRALYKATKNKPVVKFYEGYEQIKRLTFDMIKAAEEKMYFIGSTGKLYDLSPEDFPEFEHEIVEQKKFLYDMVTAESAEKTVAETKERMRAYYTAYKLPQRYEDIPTSVIIGGNSVALISFEEPIFGTSLTHANLAATFRMMFDLTAMSARKL